LAISPLRFVAVVGKALRFGVPPFDFKQFRTLLCKGLSPTPFPSITSALFPMPWRGEGISCPSARHSSLAPHHCKPCVCHTSEKSSANSFVCHTSKNRLLQVPCLPHLRYPRCVYLFLLNSGRVRPIGSKRGCLSSATSRHQLAPSFEGSRVTSHRHSSYCVRYRAVPQLALNDGSAGKQSRFFRCLKKESGQRVRQALSAGPGRRSTLNRDVGRPESSL
jgi:hypothetical protein